MDQGLLRAIARYQEAAKLAEEGSDRADSGPFLVATGISKLAYKRWSFTQEKKSQLFWNRDTQEVWLYGDPSPLHEMAAAYFLTMRGHMLPKDALNRVTTQGSPTLDIPDGLKQPDFAIRPREAKLPTIVVEVAYHNESFQRLIEEQQMWCRSDFVQFFVGLKITDWTQSQKRDPKLTLITWRRDSGTTETLEFGQNSSCTGENQMFLNIPYSCLFYQSTIPPSISEPSFKFDFFDLRERIKDENRNLSS